MIAPRSLGFRLLAGAVLWIAAALVVAWLALGELFARHVEAQIAGRMEATLNELAAVVATDADGELSTEHPLSEPRFRKPYSGFYWQVSAGDGSPLLRSRSLWDRTLDLPPDALLDGEVHRHRLPGPQGEPVIAFERSVILPARDDPLRLAVALDAAEPASARAKFERTLGLSLAVLGLGLAAAAAGQVTLGLRPLNRLRAGLTAVRAGRSERLEGRYPNEIQPLVDDLNGVLAEHGRVVERARTQAGNLAHSLKTPIAVLENEATALEGRGEAELAERLRRQTAAMRRQIDYNLARARAAAAAEVPGVRTALAPVLDGLARAMRQIHRERGVEIELDVPADLAVRGERQDLEEMAGNLLDNACKWAAQRVRVAAAAADGALVLTVDDDGPGLAPERRAEVFDRGRRLDEQTAGSGLGLAIVRDLAEPYGGTVELTDSPLGGLRARLTLPAAG